MDRLLEGWSVEDVAALVGVDARSVRRWRTAFQEQGWRALEPQAHPGRPCRLNADQRREVLSWIDQNPEDFGFVGKRWTARRLAWLIAQRWGVQYHRRHISRWLAQRAVTPQKPQRRPRERDPQAVAAWLEQDWARIKKTLACGPPR